MIDYRNIDRLWYERATLLLHVPKDGDPRQLVREGLLWEVLKFVENFPKIDRPNLTIALPDRQATPTRVDAGDIARMLDYPGRPGFSFQGS